MILGVVCSLCLAVPGGMTIRTESPQRAPEVRLVSNQPEDTLVQRVRDVVAAEHPVAVEVGNEPNYPAMWGATITPAHYVALYTAARDAARWADPNVPVISAGIVDFNDWKAWIKAIAAVAPDMIGLHPYNAPAQSTNFTRKYGTVAITEFGTGTRSWGGDDVARATYLNDSIRAFRKYKVWGTFLYSWDDPAWTIPAGVLP